MTSTTTTTTTTTSAEGSWRHAGEWDPSAVDYELDEVSVSEHVTLVQSSKAEVKEIERKLHTLESVAALGAETSEEQAEHARKKAALRERHRHQELRAAYLEVKLKERLGGGR